MTGLCIAYILNSYFISKIKPELGDIFSLAFSQSVAEGQIYLEAYMNQLYYVFAYLKEIPGFWISSYRISFC